MKGRPPAIRVQIEGEIIVDNFAGGGGTSSGIEEALGRSPDIAINHDPEAIAMHARNHPLTKHVCGNVWDVKPRTLCAGRPVGLAWFSPDCTFHSKARGSKPFRDRNVARRRRGLAWVAIRWAEDVKPRVIILENVEEFQDWGPLLDDGKPDPVRRGFTFRRWVRRLENLGYRVESRELRACDYGAPTTRKRLFVIARCDGAAIVWPRATHTKATYRTAAECIQWDLPTPSIFERKKPLAEATMRRIARGIRRYVLDAAEPFIVPVTHPKDERVHSVREPFRTITSANRGELALAAPYLARIGQTGGNGAYVNDVSDPVTTITTKAEHLLVAPSMIQVSWGEREGQAPRVLDLFEPLGTVVAGGVKQALVSAFLAKNYGGHEGPGISPAVPFATVTTQDHHAVVSSHLSKLYGTSTGAPLDEPTPTVTAGGNHLAEVRAFLIKYYGAEKQDPQLGLPLHTITTKDRFGLVTVAGEDYAIADIGMRMLVPRELYRAQGFREDYVIDPVVNGKRLSKSAQVRMCGNSVPPPLARELVRANYSVAASVGPALEEVARG